VAQATQTHDANFLTRANLPVAQGRIGGDVVTAGERAFKLAEAVAEEIEFFYHLISSMSCSNCCWTRSSDEFLRLR